MDEPEHIAQWWGPVGFTNTVYEMDVRPGRVFRIDMHGPDGTTFPNKIVYDPGAFHVTVEFRALGKKTEVGMHAVFITKEVFDRLVREFGIIEGGEQTLDRLGEYLRMLVHPILLRSGKAFFTGLSDKMPLKFLSARVFGSGLVLLSYQP